MLGSVRRFYRYGSYIMQQIRLLYSAVFHLIRDEWLGQYLPPKPLSLQFPITDMCNSRCVMCNVWQRKRDKEITSEELRQILSDSLFSKIEYVGINGGEPTLRPDLSDIGHVIVETLPRLKGMGIITNALKPRLVIERIMALAEVAKNAKVAFNVSVSLDGIGDEHDKNRGVKGNFASAVEVIHTLKQNGIPISVGCTLTPLNCYGADDVLLWCEKNDIQNWEFRLAVDIKRIYNVGYSQQHPFTPEQNLHLIMFFDKLTRHPRVNIKRRKFYHSLVNQLAFGLPRQAGCRWRSLGVTLDARGGISYCSVQSPILGSTLERSAWQLFKEGLPQWRRIIQECCPSCRHDLVGTQSVREVAREKVELWQQQWSRVRKHFSSVAAFKAPRNILAAERNSPSEWKHVLITGWYGTETAGDKAILGELLYFLNTYSPECQFTLTTLDHRVSGQTKREIRELKDVTLVDMDKAHTPELIESIDAIIISGGPLEEIWQTEHIWRMFYEANRQRKARIIFGCGIGPLYTDRLQQMVGAICQMTTAGFLRDDESRQYAIKLGGDSSLASGCDPSMAYIRRWLAGAPQMVPKNEVPLLTALVRANTGEYIVDMNRHELERYNIRTARQIAQILEPVCQARQARIDLLPMHSLWKGGDDRIFNRQVTSFFSNPDCVRVERRYLPLNNLLQSLYPANAAMAMRYHGHIFCMALGIPFLSICYTGRPSKIHSLVHRTDYGQWVEEWRHIDVVRATSRLLQLLEEHDYWSVYLQRQADEMVAELQQTYAQVFGVPQ